ncbi:hypothetical protein TIFTF001_055309 [Ficus carica]|uniref:Uncharacterized protein n=1 Tax=Ficus carica TaxID=3494 RepID=A0AA88EGW5_FICCA|nr:hypothetical protein TIFTF001_055309 [Ficus carica]
MSLISPPWSGNLWSSVSAGADFILGPARALPILVGALSGDLTPWSGNSRSWWSARADVRSLISPPWSGNLWSSVSLGADFILGPARALPILVGAWSWDLTPWSGNSRSWWSARADVRWSCSGCLLRLARVFLEIDPSQTLVGIPWQGASFLLRGPGTSGVRCMQGQISSRVLLGHFQFCSTWVTGKFYPGQQAWYLGKFYPGHGDVLPGTTMSSDAEVAGCSMIRLELGSRGPGYPCCFARPWLEWSVARGASVSFGCWKGGCPPSSAKMLMPKTLPGPFAGSGRPGRVGYGITQVGQVAAGGVATRCLSGQAEPAVDGTCVRKGMAGGARAPRALSLWNPLVRGGSSGILVG